MAWLCDRANDHETRQAWLLKALQDYPDNVLVLTAAASWRQREGQLDEAQRWADQAVTADPDDPAVALLRATITYLRRDYANAEEQLNELATLYPSNADIADQLALTLLCQDDPVKKRRGLQLAIQTARLNPESPVALSTLGWAHYQNGQLQPAAQSLQAAMRTGVTNSDTAYYMACVLQAAGDSQNAKQLCDAALEAQGPFHFRTEAEELAGLLVTSNSPSKASDVVREGTGTAPDGTQR